MIYSQVVVSLDVLHNLRWPLRAETSLLDGVTVVTLSGRVARESAATLSKAINDRLAARETRLVLDFAGVDYISSAGLSALQAGVKAFQASGGTVMLSGIDGPLGTTFRLAALSDGFIIEGSPASAVARFASMTR
jgi:anti-sigma B factor antagonist